MRTNSATRLVVLGGLVVVVAKFRQVGVRLEELAVPEELDAPGHELMDLKLKSMTI